MGHVHQGVAGVNGDVKVPLFTTAVPENIFAVAGSVPSVSRDVTSAIQAKPSGFYTNLHTADELLDVGRLDDLVGFGVGLLHAVPRGRPGAGRQWPTPTTATTAARSSRPQGRPRRRR